MQVSIVKSTCAAILLSLGISVQASTFWAAAGVEFTEDGSVIVAGNRDDLPTLQTYQEIADESGFAFKGIFLGKTQKFDSGINEKGLFVATTTAASVPLADRRNSISKRFKTPEGMYAPEWIMRQCATVQDALSHPELFRGYPMNFILADRTEIAIVECLPRGKFNVERKSTGVLTHTNHYTQEASLASNDKIPASTEQRLLRINAILNETPAPYSFNQFIATTQDAVAGPDMSIFRVGSKPQSPRTLYSIAVKIPPRGSSQLYVRYQDDSSNPKWKVLSATVGR